MTRHVALRRVPGAILCPLCAAEVPRGTCARFGVDVGPGAFYSCRACGCTIGTVPCRWMYSAAGSGGGLVLFTPFVVSLKDDEAAATKRPLPTRTFERGIRCPCCSRPTRKLRGGEPAYVCGPCELIADSGGSVLGFAPADEVEAAAQRDGRRRGAKA